MAQDIRTELVGAAGAALAAGAVNDALRAVLDQMPVGVAIAETPSGRFLYQNARATALLGHPRLEVADFAAYDVFGAVREDGTPYPPEQYPLFRAARGGETIDREPLLYRRGDGATVELEVSASPVLDAGAAAFVVATFEDVSARKRAERALAATEAHLARALESTTDGVFILSRDWRFTYLNARAKARIAAGRDLIGLTLWEAFPEVAGSSFEQAYREAMETGRPTRAEEPYAPLDAWFEANACPTEDGLTVFFRDVTKARRAEAERRILIGELNHRMKNVFALAQGMVSATARGSGSVREMADALRGRFQALARAHELIAPALEPKAPAPDASLRALVERTLAPHAPLESPRLELSGGEVRLGPSAATAFALILHELATNAAKHGALSSSEDRLVLAWRLEGDDLILVWRETGSPQGAPPEGEGFGSRLVRMAAEGQLGGRIEHVAKAEGVEVVLRVSAARLGR